MDNDYCCVLQCNSLGSRFPRTSFHRFPSEKNRISKRRREERVSILKIGKRITNRMVVCGKHYQPSDFSLKEKTAFLNAFFNYFDFSNTLGLVSNYNLGS